jgi:hypothetical protein
MAFVNDKVNGNIVHCTQRFQADILANDFTTDATNWGGYSTDGADVVGGTANATAQTGVSHGSATMATDGTAIKRVWSIQVGKYERIRYRFEIFADSDHDDGDVKYGFLVPTSATVTQLREHTGDVPIPDAGSSDELITFHDTAAAAVTNSTTVPDGTWITMNTASTDQLADEDGEGVIQVTGVLEASSTQGEFGFYFGLGTTHASPSRIKAGSTFEYFNF